MTTAAQGKTGAPIHMSVSTVSTALEIVTRHHVTTVLVKYGAIEEPTEMAAGWEIIVPPNVKDGIKQCKY